MPGTALCRLSLYRFNQGAGSQINFYMEAVSSIHRIISLPTYLLAGRLHHYIHEHSFASPRLLQVAELSRHFAVCESVLRKAYLQRYGRTIHRDILLARHERICELLALPQYSIKEIAIMAGYTELANFSRDFSRLSGQSPRTYRQSQLLGRDGTVRHLSCF